MDATGSVGAHQLQGLGSALPYHDVLVRQERHQRRDAPRHDALHATLAHDQEFASGHEAFLAHDDGRVPKFTHLQR
tara:strand:- start:65 stop:292 length:228 start_codon:yes stop_codon:yes gene_type:complete